MRAFAGGSATSSSDSSRSARGRAIPSHLESVAGNFAAAREQPGRSLALEVFTHDAIAKAIVAIGNSPPQGFALLHWVRLGRAASMYLGAEREEFLAAVKVSKSFELSWLTGEHKGYPVHGILRHAAVVQTIQGSVQAALGCLSHVRRAVSGLVHSTIVLAATVEVAALLWAKHRNDAQSLLDNKDAERLGALQQLQSLGHAAKDSVPELWAVFEPWEVQIRGALSGGPSAPDPKDGLLWLARVVPY